jgi:hypothetical protein
MRWRFSSKRDGKRRAERRNHRRRVTMMVAAIGVETAALWLRTSQIGGNIVVRCRDGHLFTTIWIPGASLKSLRLGLWRFQRCPLGQHWSLVTPVRQSDLPEEERRLAHEHKDIRIP